HAAPLTVTERAASGMAARGEGRRSLSCTAQQGGSTPAAQTVSLRNTGGGTLSWTASDNAAWLTLSPAAGTGNGAVTLSATTGTQTGRASCRDSARTAGGAAPSTAPADSAV